MQRLLGDGQVCLVIEGGLDADLYRPAGEEQQREFLAGEGVEPGQARPFPLLPLVLGGVERVKDVLQVRRRDAAAGVRRVDQRGADGRLFETLQGRLTLLPVRSTHGQLLAECVMVAGAMLSGVV